MKILFDKKLSISIIMIVVMAPTLMIMNSCAVSQKVADKTGTQLWAENCQRCHNIPSASSFSPEKWETIGMHMQSRALLTENEKEKIVKFLKQ